MWVCSRISFFLYDRSKGSIAFQFRTAEKGGLIMYSNGNRDSKDFFALEIMDGQLYLVFNMGSGIQKVNLSLLISYYDYAESSPLCTALYNQSRSLKILVKKKNRRRRRRRRKKKKEEKICLFVWLVGFLTTSSTTRLYRGWAPRQSV